MTIIIFLIVLAILIFVHEFGHFVAARSFGIRVDAFALGFGPKLFAWRTSNKDASGHIVKGETEYSIRLIPFGGFVKIFGENPDDENTHGPDAKRSFVNKPRWQQAVVLAAGVICNFIFAWVLYAVVFTSGVTASSGDFPQYAGYFNNDRIMITEVMPDSPASKSGLRVGDAINGFDSIEAVQQTIKKSDGKTIVLSYSSHGQIDNIDITPTRLSSDNGFMIGIAMEKVSDMHLPFYVSIWEGLKYTCIMIKNTIVGMASFFLTIVRGSADYSQISGPIGIAGIVGDAAGLGFTYLVMVTAIISINLGVINLVPFPALDGGRIFVVAIEALIRRRISSKFINIVNIIGFSLLMALMVLVTYKDILKLVK